MNGERENLRGAVALSHLFLRERVRLGDAVADATCGNGRDTLLLAELVGAAGRVWSFDIQEEALRSTAAALEKQGLRERVELVAAGHERLGEFIRGPLRAAVFNLGYLPGGDKGMVTRPETTRPALDAALDLLAPGGLLLVAVYTGHPGALEEEDAVLSWACGLDPRAFHVWVSRQLNRPLTAPYLVFIEKGE